MQQTSFNIHRRDFLSAATAGTLTAVSHAWVDAKEPPPRFPTYDKAQITITLDLEMSRNFPNWEDTHWDYEKGNLNQAAKDYTVEACRRVKQRGGRVHTFALGQTFEQSNLEWLVQISREGHPIGNHTYDHIYLLADSHDKLQYRFRRSPWLLGNRSVSEIIRDNIALTNLAIKERLGIDTNGFRTPGGFANGLNGREDLQLMLMGLGFEWISCRYPAFAATEDIEIMGDSPSQTVYDKILAAQVLAQPYAYPTGLLDLPMSPISDIGAFRIGRWKLEHFLHAIQLAIDWAIENRAYFDFLAHPSCLGVVDREFSAIELICDKVEQSDGAAEIVTLDTVAKRARAQLTSNTPLNEPRSLSNSSP